VSLSLREKQRLYLSLAQLVRSGIPFPTALEKLANTTRGATRQLVVKLRSAAVGGKSVGDAFAAGRPAITVLEATVVGAGERSGRLDHGLQELSDYFGSLAQARATVIKRLAYPVFLLHFGIIILAVPKFFMEDARAFFVQAFGTLGAIYAVAALIAVLVPLLSDAGATNAAIDRLLRAVPLLGKIRRSFALSRFCTVYEIQLDAGVNVIDSLVNAGRASRSAMVRSAVDVAVPEVRSGAQVGPLLAVSGAFTEELVHSLIVGEETGRLDQELRRLAEDLRNEAVGTLETFSEWMPKLIYVAIMLYLAYSIVTGYMGILQRTMNVFE
jgi:type II secretory pathway component PulF